VWAQEELPGDTSISGFSLRTWDDGLLETLSLRRFVTEACASPVVVTPGCHAQGRTEGKDAIQQRAMARMALPQTHLAQTEHNGTAENP
jgi:hypothetical protein